MPHFLKKLQKKPIAQRKTIVVVSTTVITALIFTIWLSTFSIANQKDSMKVSADSQTATPMGALKENLGVAAKGIKNQIDTIKQMFGSQKTYEAPTDGSVGVVENAR